MKLNFFLILTCCIVAALVEARSKDLPVQGEHPGGLTRGRLQRIRAPQPQARVFPGAVAIKKLVLLKFKKIVPISLILLRSSNENEAELVPVYPTEDIPDDVKFIPTPNGISGHKDVQAIAIPSALHDQLELEGLADVEKLQALLQQADVDKPTHMQTQQQQVGVNSDEILMKEDEDEQLLEDVAYNEEMPVQKNTSTRQKVRRLAGQNRQTQNLKSFASQATLEEVPLIIYSDNNRKNNNMRVQYTNNARRHVGMRRNFY